MTTTQKEGTTSLKKFTLTIPAAIHVSVLAIDADAIDGDMVEHAMLAQHGNTRWISLKNGKDFDTDTFDVLDEEDATVEEIAEDEAIRNGDL